MAKRTILVALISAFLLVACGGTKQKTDAFRGELDKVRTEFRAAAQLAKTRAEYVAAQEKFESSIRELISRYEALKGDEAELLRIQAAIDIREFDQASEKIEKLEASDSPYGLRAKLEKVGLMIIREEFETGTELFKSIESELTVDEKVMEVWLNLAFSAPDPADRSHYGNLFLAAEQLPEHLARFTSHVVQALAFEKKDAGDLDGARQMLKDAIAKETDERTRSGLEAELKILDLIGQPATALEAETWMNSKPLNLASLKGNVVLVDFWATWCPPCRVVIPTLVEAYNEMRDQGLQVIGYTKLYGFYRDDQRDEGKVDPEKELVLTREFLDRLGITYPVAVSTNDEGFSAYGVRSIPTLFFIDRNGVIVDAEKGSESAGKLKEKIAELLTK